MPKLYLVRHGRAAASFDQHHDPALDAEGVREAAAAAEKLVGLRTPLLVTSPMLRCRETAAPLEKLWARTARIEPRVSEIPSPTEDLAARTDWLRNLMAGSWASAEAAAGGDLVRAWREDVLAALLAEPGDAVIFSHFVAINVAVGHALGDDQVVVFRPGNASITELQSDGKRLTLIARGEEAVTAVR